MAASSEGFSEEKDIHFELQAKAIGLNASVVLDMDLDLDLSVMVESRLLCILSENSFPYSAP